MQYIIVGILTIVFLPFINTQHDDKIILRIYLLCLATFLYCELINYLLSLYYNIPIIFSRTLPQISNEYDFPIYLIKYIVGTLSYKISLSKKRISGLNFVYSIIISISLTITFALTFSADIFIDHYPFYESEKLIINIKNIYKIIIKPEFTIELISRLSISFIPALSIYFLYKYKIIKFSIERGTKNQTSTNQDKVKFLFCAHCGAAEGEYTDCAIHNSHSFKWFDEDAYCPKCGMKVGKGPKSCVNGQGHSFR